MFSKGIFVFKVIIAVIILQTLFYKFSGAEESVALFTKLAGENEAYLRVGVGVLELIACILFFIPKTVWLGATMIVGLMAGAIFSHFTILGIPHNNDGGLLFGSACLSLVVALIVLYIERKNIPLIGKRFFL
ncbi:DoxX family protein [Polaribacter batillariae]|uniref:DoxX family protein n=1 Tax=Polaribacter batillariae TaxID=2808900 RepID=A0ABX7SW14_9FLAO|nr:DoxX family protein [Polaribacter batillariae]QTD38440.1 DoxX family protein [Polaribacter batillariae]